MLARNRILTVATTLLTFSLLGAECPKGITINKEILSTSSANIAKVAKEIAAMGVSEVYIQAKGLKEGTSEWSKAKELIDAFKQEQPTGKILAFVGAKVCALSTATDCFHMESGSKSVERLTARIGSLNALFDGVQLDMEPVPNDSPEYLELLKEIKKHMNGKTLSIAGYMVGQNKAEVDANSKLLMWDKNYYRQVAQLVDHVLVMNYDTGKQVAYIDFTKRQSEILNKEVFNGLSTEWRMGIPAYKYGRANLHFDKSETSSAALAGINNAMTSCPANFGIAAYVYDEMTAADKATLTQAKIGESSLATGKVKVSAPHTPKPVPTATEN